MKRIIATVLCATVVLIASSFSVLAVDWLGSSTTDEYFPEGYIGYRYPVVPGTDEWNSLKTHQDKVDACQIPQEVLATMSTAELVETILAYPLNCDMFAYNDINTGYSIVKEHFNGMIELERRDNATNELVMKYSSSDLSIFSNSPSRISQESSSDHFEVIVLSALISLDEYRNDLSPQNVTVMKDTFDNYAVFDSNIEFVNNSSNPRSTSAIPVGIVRYDQCNGTETSVRTPNRNPVDAYYDIDCVALWLFSDYTLQYALTAEDDYPSDYCDVLDEEMYETYGINAVSPASAEYNCHSYAWYNRSANNKYWLDYPGAYITDGSYEEVEKLYVEVGGRMVYYESHDGTCTTPSHSAIITSIRELPRGKREFTVISKWGPYGVYEHAWFNCPYYYDGAFSVDLKYFN